jgi:prenyltransferase beta subunit
MKRTVLLALGLLVLVPPVRAQSADEKKATISYLQKLQTKNGGFLSKSDDKEPSLRATSSALRAVHYFGGEALDKGRAADFVQNCYDDSAGAFANQPKGKPEVFTTAVGLMAVVELKMPAAKYEEPAMKYLLKNARTFEEVRIAVAGLEAIGKTPPGDEWLALVSKMGNGDGTFGKGPGEARDTGGAVVALLRMGAKVDKSAVVLKTLNAGQRKDGGYGKADAAGSDLESTYRVLRAYHMLKAKPEHVDGLRKFIASCRNADGGYGVAPGQESNVSGTYYAAIISHWLSE